MSWTEVCEKMDPSTPNTLAAKDEKENGASFDFGNRLNLKPWNDAQSRTPALKGGRLATPSKAPWSLSGTPQVRWSNNSYGKESSPQPLRAGGLRNWLGLPSHFLTSKDQHVRLCRERRLSRKLLKWEPRHGLPDVLQQVSWHCIVQVLHPAMTQISYFHHNVLWFWFQRWCPLKLFLWLSMC